VVVRVERIIVGKSVLPLTYIDCGEKGGFEAIIAHWHLLEAQQTVDEQGLESSQELPFVELHMLATVITVFKITTTGTYLGKYVFLLELDQPPYKVPA
jgi:hypothetical protein